MAGGVHVGDAWVAVHPETKDFYHKIAQQLKDKDGDLKVPVRPEVDRDKWQKDFDDAFKDDKDKPKVAVTLDKDRSKLRDDLAKDFRNKPITVHVRLSEGDRAAVAAELKGLTEDETKLIHVRTVGGFAIDDDAFAKEIDKHNRNTGQRHQAYSTVRLQLDKKQVYNSLKSLGQVDVPVRMNLETLNETLDEARGILDEFAGTYTEPWWDIHVRLHAGSLSKVKSQMKALTRDQTKTITVKYRESGMKGQDGIRERIKSITGDDNLQARVKLVADDFDFNAALDKDHKVNIKPVLNQVAAQAVEQKLDKLTRQRMVEVVMGEERFSGFTEDLGQALQTAWDDLDPRLSFKDVFGDEAPQRDEVQKVFVVNQVETTPAPGTAPTLDNPAPVSVAGVDTDKPVTTKPEAGTAASASSPGKKVNEPKDSLVTDKTFMKATDRIYDSVHDGLDALTRAERARAAERAQVPEGFYERVDRSISRTKGRQLTGDMDSIKTAQLDALRAQLDRFELRAKYDQGYEAEQRATLRWVDSALGELVAKYHGPWKPDDSRHLQWMLENNDLGAGRTLGKLRAGNARAESVEEMRRYYAANEANNRMFADFLRAQIDYLSGKGLGKGAIGHTEETSQWRYEKGQQTLDHLADKTDALRRAVEDNTYAVTDELREYKKWNLARMEEDPGAKRVSFEKWQRLRYPGKGLQFGFDWEGVDDPKHFSRAFERATAPNGRDGQVLFRAKNMASSLLKPFGKMGDAAWRFTHAGVKGTSQASQNAIGSLSNNLIDGTKAAGNLGVGLGKNVKDTLDFSKISPGGSSLGDMLGGGGGKGGKMKGGGPASAIAGTVLETVGALVGMHTKLGAFGLALGGISESLAGLGAMGSSVLVPFANSLKGIMFAPALFTSLAAGVGATVLAFKGIGAAFTEQDAFNDLAKNAQDFVSTTRDMAPAFADLQGAVQQSFFTGWGDAMRDLAQTTMPALQRSLPKVAEGFGGMGQTFVKALGRKDIAKNLEDALVAAGDGFQRMRPGIESLTDFWMQVSRVGAEHLMPKLGDGFSNLMESWRNWATDEKLTGIFDSAIDGLSKVSDFAGTAWAGLGDFFKGAAAGADAAFGDGGVWGAMMDKLHQFRDWAGSSAGQSSLSNFFQGATESAKQVGEIMGTWGEKIVTETGPAFREFIGRYGDDIKDIGSSIVDAMTNGMYAIGPILEAIKGPIEGIAKTAEFANELAGGPGSSKHRKQINADANDMMSLNNEMYERYTGQVGNFGTEVEAEARAEVFDRLVAANNELANSASIDGKTAEYQNLLAATDHLAMTYEGMRGGFQGVQVTADATAATFKRLGDSIVDLPDDKTIEVKGEGTEQIREALSRIGADVDELDNGNYSIKFNKDMDIEGALDKIKSQIQDMPEAEVKARGLDTLMSHLESVKAGMGEMSNWVINVSQEGDVEPPEGGTVEWLRNIVDTGNVEDPEPGTVEWLRNIIESGAVEDPPSGTVEWLRSITNGGDEEPPAGLVEWIRQITNNDPGAPPDSQSNHDRNVQNNDPGAPPDSQSNHDRVVQNTGDAPPGNTSSTHTIYVQTVGSLNARDFSGGVKQSAGMQADGGIVARAYADGGFEDRQAFIAKGGSYILWGENETEDESYIPHSMAKRKRATQVLLVTANKFGLRLVDDTGNDVERNGTHVGPTGRTTTFANGGITGNTKGDKKKKKPPATAAQKEQLEKAKKRNEEIEALKDKEYARRLVGIERGRFIYKDTTPDHDDAVKSVDRAGLIPTRVGIRRYMERDEDVSVRTLTMLAAMEADGYSLPPEGEKLMREHGHKLPPEVRYRIRHRNELPAHVRKALLTGELIEDPDAPVNLNEVLDSRDWGRAAGVIAANPKDKKAWMRAGDMVRDEATNLGRYIGQSYADEAASEIGLNVTKLRDIPLYNLANPSAEAYNELIRDVHGARREVEGDYRDKYQEESKIRRDAERIKREEQQGGDKAKKKDDRTAEQMAKDIAAQDKKNREEMAQYNAGMKAVREHRAAQQARAARSTSQSRGGLTVNQTIGNITTNSVQDAADRFRRQSTVGFENLVGSI